MVKSVIGIGERKFYSGTAGTGSYQVTRSPVDQWDFNQGTNDRIISRITCDGKSSQDLMDLVRATARAIQESTASTQKPYTCDVRSRLPNLVGRYDRSPSEGGKIVEAGMAAIEAAAIPRGESAELGFDPKLAGPFSSVSVGVEIKDGKTIYELRAHQNEIEALEPILVEMAERGMQ
ncbi:MAG: hypothetical protein Q7R96_03510 [Nanoarchaeota archaeon]|nr:hypothetical protein [Nanoarchaeota archaeon]